MRILRLSVVTTCVLLAGCGRPAEKPAAELTFSAEPPAVEPVTGIVPIPEEFQPPQEAPAPSQLPATLPVLFVARDFQITNRAGIQGIRVGEAVNLLRETPDEYIVQYGDLEFIKEKEYFSSTFVGKSEPASSEPPSESLAQMPAESGPDSPAAVPEAPALESAPPASEPSASGDSADGIGLAAPVAAERESPLPAEPAGEMGLTAPVAEAALPDEAPLPDLPPLPPTAADQKLADLTDAIRKLNNQIRAAEDAAIASGKKPTRAERRRLEQLKEERDDLSRQLTKLGKP